MPLAIRNGWHRRHIHPFQERVHSRGRTWSCVRRISVGLPSSAAYPMFSHASGVTFALKAYLPWNSISRSGNARSISCCRSTPGTRSRTRLSSKICLENNGTWPGLRTFERWLEPLLTGKASGRITECPTVLRSLVGWFSVLSAPQRSQRFYPPPHPAAAALPTRPLPAPAAPRLRPVPICPMATLPRVPTAPA